MTYKKLTERLVDILKGDAATPPPGFSAIPGSRHGGFRKKQGDRYIYWYPDSSQRSGGKYEDKARAESPGAAALDALLEALFPSKGLPKRKISMQEVRDALKKVHEEQKAKKKKEKESTEEKSTEEESTEEEPTEDAPTEEKSQAKADRDEARAKFRETANDWIAEQETAELEVVQDELEALISEARQGGLSEEKEREIREQLRDSFETDLRTKKDKPKPKKGKKKPVKKSLQHIWETLWKAKATKYIRRVPTGDPKRPWRYYYRESASAREVQEGERLKLGNEHVVIKAVKEDGTVIVEHPGFNQPITFAPDEWRNELRRYYGDTYTKSAEKRARQAINAVLRLVPKEKLAELRGDTDAERLKDLKKRMPDLYKRLSKAFSRAGMSPQEAKSVLSYTLDRRGWDEEARAALIGNVISEKGGWAAKNYRRIAADAENIAGKDDVTAGHVQSSIDVLHSIRTDSVEKVLKKADAVLEKTLKMVLAAR